MVRQPGSFLLTRREMLRGGLAFTGAALLAPLVPDWVAGPLAAPIPDRRSSYREFRLDPAVGASISRCAWRSTQRSSSVTGISTSCPEITTLSSGRLGTSCFT